jgi:large subunit ribosomal protein L34e
MPQPNKRSRSLRRLNVRMPGGKTKKVYKARLPGVAQCADCGAELKGIPRMHTAKAKNAPKSTKRVERPYGGNLCSGCTRHKLKIEARQQ